VPALAHNIFRAYGMSRVPTFAQYQAAEAAAHASVSRALKDRLSNRAQSLKCNASGGVGASVFDAKLVRTIGSESVDGSVYEAELPGSGTHVACKVQRATPRALREGKILDAVTKIALKGAVHLPVSYGSARCGNSHMVTFTSLLDGDMKQWFASRTNRHATTPAQFGSAAAQVVLGFAQLHMAGIAHCDSHWAQVLYKRIAPGGVWHYRVGGKDLYVRNGGYLFKVWDFGKSGRLGKACKVKDPSSNYANAALNVHHALGPFHNPEHFTKKHGAVRPDTVTVAVATEVSWLARHARGQTSAAATAIAALEHLYRLPGASAAKPAGTRVLNKKPMLIS